MGATFLIALAVIIPVALFFAYLVIRVRYKKAGPDEALIVFGRRKIFGKKVRTQAGEIEGFRIIRGGGTFVWPAWEQYEMLSLRMMTLEIDMPHVYTIQGIPINVKAVAQVKVQGDIDHIRSAAEGFLGMPVDDIKATIKETVAGHLRGIVGTLTVEELYRDQRRFQEKVREEAHVDLEGMGFEFRSFVFRAIQDDQGYLNALGQPKIQEALKNARIATAGADRDAAIEEEQARQQKEQKRINVDTEIAEADKALSLKVASIKKEVDVADAQAVKAGEMELKVQDIRIADQEVKRQKLELNAAIREQADAKKYEAERLADAKKYTVEQEAGAERLRREQAAKALQAEGVAKAEAESVQRRQIGLAEAEAILAKGEAEAESAAKVRRSPQALQRGRAFDRGPQGAAGNRGRGRRAVGPCGGDHDHFQRRPARRRNRRRPDDRRCDPGPVAAGAGNEAAVWCRSRQSPAQYLAAPGSGRRQYRGSAEKREQRR